MKTFKEWYSERIQCELAAAPTPGATPPTPITPGVQKVAKNVMNSMGNSLVPPKPNMTMANFLTKNPNIVADFQKRLMANPAASNAGEINLDTAQQLLMGGPKAAK